jgi:hypothetical protein
VGVRGRSFAPEHSFVVQTGLGCDASALHGGHGADDGLLMSCTGQMVWTLVVGVWGRSFAPELSFVVQTGWGAMLRPYTDGMRLTTDF